MADKARTAPLVRTDFLRGDPNSPRQYNVVLELGGEKRYDVLSVVTTFALNSVPTASVTLAVGVTTDDARNEKSTTQLADLVAYLAGHDGDVDADLWIAMQGDFDQYGVPWPEGGHQFFSGFVAGQPSVTVISGQITATLPLRHVLSELAYSSALTATYHQGFSQRFAVPLGGFAGNGATGAPVNLSHMIEHEAVAQAVKSDVWGAIKQFLVEVCNQNIVRQICSPQLIDTQTNDAGLDALATIEGPSSDGFKQYARDYVDGAATPLVGEAAVHPYVLTAVADFIAQAPAELFGANDLWTLLVGYFFPNLSLVLAPTALGAVVLPDASSLSPENVHAVITTDEQFAPNVSMNEGRLIKGVIVLADAMSENGLLMGGQGGEAPKPLCAGGAYIRDQLPGSILPVAAPRWLEGVQSADGFAPTTTGVKGDVPVRNAIKPTDIDPPKNNPDATRDDTKALFEAYAKSVFTTERLRGRRGSVTGKLRFDVGPGSLVRIDRTNDLFAAAGDDESATALYGYVYQATIAISANPPSATTTFGVSNLRSWSEVFEHDEWFAEHPLYGAVAKPGVPIVRDYPTPP